MQSGASKVFITSRKASACAAAVAALNALPNLAPGAKAISVPADSSTEAGIKDLLKQVQAHTDRVDILLANAGATWGEHFDTHPDAAIAKVLDLNVRSVFNTVRLFAPLLEKAGAVGSDPSRVVVTGSVAGLGLGTLGSAGTYGYSASKAAVIHMARNLAVELAPRGINVNSIAPGFFPSKMANGLLEMGGGAEALGKLNPTGRLGSAEDFAGATVFLCSRAGAHVNGATLVVDGGAMWVTGELHGAAGEMEKRQTKSKL